MDGTLRTNTSTYDGIQEGTNVFHMTAITPEGVESERSAPFNYEYIEATPGTLGELIFRMYIKNVGE